MFLSHYTAPNKSNRYPMQTNILILLVLQERGYKKMAPNQKLYI